MILKQVLASTLFLASFTASANGPIASYYVVGGDGSSLWGIHGTDYVINAAAGSNEGPLAIVAPDMGPEIRTAGISPFNKYGTGYLSVPELTLSPTGSTYSHTVASLLVDGTSDSQHNYSVGYALGAGAGKVFSFDQDWSNAVPLFSTGNPLSFGITFDRWNNSLWVTADNGSNTTVFSDYSLSGSLLSRFTAIQTDSYLTALAMDVDHTLWTVSSNGTGNGVLYHYATDGTYLGSVTLAEPIEHARGGEIGSGVPELDALSGGGALFLLGFALALAGERRRRT